MRTESVSPGWCSSCTAAWSSPPSHSTAFATKVTNPRWNGQLESSGSKVVMTAVTGPRRATTASGTSAPSMIDSTSEAGAMAVAFATKRSSRFTARRSGCSRRSERTESFSLVP